MPNSQPLTTSQNLFDPLIWGPLLQAEFRERSIIGTSPAVISADTLTGTPGSTVRFPRWRRMEDMTDVAETEDLPLDELTQEQSEATIKEAGKALSYTDTAQLVGLGDIETEAVRQFGILAARKIDGDLINVAINTIQDGHLDASGTPLRDSKPYEHNLEDTAITWDGIVDGLEQFGDEYDPTEYAGLYIRAEQRSQIMKDEVFLKASEVASSGTPGSMIRRGFIGEIAGLPVYVTNRLPANKFVLLRNNSLGLLHKRAPIIERDRLIIARKNIVTINMHYATKRLDDRGVLVYTLDEATPGNQTPGFPAGPPTMAWLLGEIQAYATAALITLPAGATKPQALALIYTQEETEPVVAWGLEVIKAYAALHEVTLADNTDLVGSVAEIHAYWLASIYNA